MRHPTLLALALPSIVLAVALGCGDDSSSPELGPTTPDQAPGCPESAGSPSLLSLEIDGGFGGLQDYVILLERSGRMTISCASGTRTSTQLSASTLREILSARRRARLDELGPEYLGEGADGFEYVLTDLACSQPIQIRTDDYAMPEPLVDLITFVARAAFDAQHPFAQACDPY